MQSELKNKYKQIWVQANEAMTLSVSVDLFVSAVILPLSAKTQSTDTIEGRPQSTQHHPCEGQ